MRERIASSAKCCSRASICARRGRRAGRARRCRALVGEAGWNVPALRQLAASAASIAIVDDGVMQSLSALDSAPSLLFIVDAPPRVPILPGVASVVLDRVQDPGNVGAILRSAAAFAFTQIIALEGTAALWSPKVVRAGMGAHFSLRLIEGADAAQLDPLGVPLYGTSSHAKANIGATPLDLPCAWALGHEGRGLSPAVAGRCVRTLRIAHASGQESLNVAAAAAICFYESARAGAGAPNLCES